MFIAVVVVVVVVVVVRSTYDSDLQRAQVSPRNIVSYLTNTISDDLVTLQVNRISQDIL